MGWRWRQRSNRKSGLGLTEEEVFSQLEKSEDSYSLFLWRYSHRQMTHRLERAGILSRVRELGYGSPVVTFGIEEGVHFLILETPGEKAPLMDLRLSEESRLAADSTGGAVTLIRSSSPCALRISFREARGVTLTARSKVSLRCWR